MNQPLASRVSRRFVVVSLAVCWVVACGFELAGAGRWLDERVGRPALFALRSQLGRDPTVPDRLKIFSFDDQAVSFVGSTTLALSDWALVLKSLDAAGARVVIIDKIFDAPVSAAESRDFAATLKTLRVPVVAGGFTQRNKIVGREETPTERPFYAAETWGFGTDLALSRAHGYGPLPEVVGSFAAVGHLEIEGQVQRPAIGLENGRVFPAAILASLYFDPERQGSLTAVGSAPNPFVVDLIAPEAYQKRTYSMKALISRARKGAAIDPVQAGDVVLLLPAMFTGNTDFKSSVHGEVPGGWVLAAGISNALRGAWLSPVGAPLLWLTLAILAGALLAFAAVGARFWALLVGAALAVFVASFLAFLFARLVFPWPLPVAALVLSGVTLFAERMRAAREAGIRLALELDTARLVQNSFFPGPSSTSAAAGLKVAGFMQAAAQCSGDWWWHCSVRGAEYVLIGDAVGHGVPAALITAMAFSAVQARLLDEAQNDSPAALLSVVNRVIASAPSRFGSMSMTACRIDLAQREMTFANAGHIPFYLLAASETDDRLSDKRKKTTPRLKGYVRASPLLGTDAASTFRDETVPLRPGDVFVFSTDGVTENANAQGERWGSRGLSSRISELSARDAGGVVDELSRAITAHHGTGPRQDDWTIVALTYEG